MLKTTAVVFDVLWPLALEFPFCTCVLVMYLSMSSPGGGGEAGHIGQGFYRSLWPGGRAFE